MQECRGITSQVSSSSGGESRIAVSLPEQELITVLSASMMCLHCFLRSKTIHQVLLDLLSPILLAPVLSSVILYIHVCTAVWILFQHKCVFLWCWTVLL